MSPPAAGSGTRRPRLLPGALLASALVVATAGGVLAVTGGSDAPAVEACSSGQEWVTVQPVIVVSDWFAGKTTVTGPTLAGCLDTSRLGPDDRSPAPDSRG